MDNERARLAYRRPKSGTSWPLWVILGVFAFGIIGFIAQTGISPKRSGGAGAGTPLVEGRCYCISMETPLCAECGQRLSGAGAPAHELLPPGCQIGIIRVDTRAGVRWYLVQAVASDGKTPIGTGWVSAASLTEQHLTELR